MKIKKLSVSSFGKLSDTELELDDRITVITGRNEAGKSSIAAFIKYMLYGFNASRSNELSENSKKKYMPWEKEVCSGEMEFCDKDGNSYKAVRATSLKNQSCVFDGDGMPTDISSAGEHFLGVDEGCFRKTAFIGESAVSFSDTGELDEAIRNMVYSADEGADSAKALKKLENVRKFYLGKTGKSGEIANLNNEIAELEQNRDKWQTGHKELLSAEYNLEKVSEKIAFNNAQKKKLEEELKNREALDAKNKLCELGSLKEEAEKYKKEFEEHFSLMQNGSFVPDSDTASSLDELLRSVSSAKQNVKESLADVEKAREGVEGVYTDKKQREYSTNLEQSGKTSEEILSRLDELTAKSRKYLIIGIWLCVLLVTILAGLWFLFAKRGEVKKQIKALCALMGCENEKELREALTGVSAYRSVEKSAKDILKNAAQKNIRAENELREKLTSLEEFADKCGFDKGEDSEKLCENGADYLASLRDWLDKQADLKIKCNKSYVAYNTLLGTLDVEDLSSKSAQYNEDIPAREETAIRREITFYTQNNEALTVKERELEKTAAVLSGTLPKPAEIQSRINSLTAQRSDMVKKHSALELAIETLENACESMKKQASPLIATESSELFSKITDGKYNALFTDTGMKLSFADENTSLPKDAGFLSTGTLDAAYISLRVALCKYLYKERPVLVFDDAFSHMDDQRLKNTLEYLWTLSEDFQIVILSCHTREKEFFEGKGKIASLA